MVYVSRELTTEIRGNGLDSRMGEYKGMVNVSSELTTTI